LVPLLEVLGKLIFPDHLDPASEAGYQHSPHDSPHLTEPGRRIHDQEVRHPRWDFALEHHHEVVAIIHREVFHGPIVHICKEGDAVGCIVLLFVHYAHYVDKVVDDVFNGSLLGTISRGFHVKDFIAILGLKTRKREKGLGQKLLAQTVGSQAQVATLVVVHRLPRRGFVETSGRSALRKEKDRTVIERLPGITFLPSSLEILETFEVLRVQYGQLHRVASSSDCALESLPLLVFIGR